MLLSSSGKEFKLIKHDEKKKTLSGCSLKHDYKLMLIVKDKNQKESDTNLQIQESLHSGEEG